jgi:hypothetical protein
LEKFCDSFFQNHKDAASVLSPYGVLGFAPEDESFTVIWMKAFARWVRNMGETTLNEMNSLVERHRSKMRRAWIPAW